MNQGHWRLRRIALSVGVRGAARRLRYNREQAPAAPGTEIPARQAHQSIC